MTDNNRIDHPVQEVTIAGGNAYKSASGVPVDESLTNSNVNNNQREFLMAVNQNLSEE